jgi:hypothetical protein
VRGVCVGLIMCVYAVLDDVGAADTATGSTQGTRVSTQHNGWGHVRRETRKGLILCVVFVSVWM